jgi:hypothetical protein
MGHLMQDPSHLVIRPTVPAIVRAFRISGIAQNPDVRHRRPDVDAPSEDIKPSSSRRFLAVAPVSISPFPTASPILFDLTHLRDPALLPADGLMVIAGMADSMHAMLVS